MRTSERCGGAPGRPWWSALALAGVVACAPRLDLPPVELDGAGWRQWHGQALWERGEDGRDVAGELLAARGPDGEVFVTLAKPPLTLFTARAEQGVWQLRTVQEDRVRSGRGRPPRQLIWFYLPGVLAGEEPPPPWAVERRAADDWLLTHPETGERVRVLLD